MFLSFFQEPPPLETPRLLLRRLRLSDARDLFEYASDPEVARHVLWQTHTSLSQSRAFLKEARRQYRSGFPGSFALVLKDSQKMIGTIGFMWINPEYHSCEVGYSLNRNYWNRGLMTEALRAVIAFAFNELRLNRVEAQHEVDNPASGRVMAKASMRYEGTLRQRIRNKGHYSDVAVYAILRRDFNKGG